MFIQNEKPTAAESCSVSAAVCQHGGSLCWKSLTFLPMLFQGRSVVPGAVAEDLRTLLWKRGLPHPSV